MTTMALKAAGFSTAQASPVGPAPVLANHGEARKPKLANELRQIGDVILQTEIVLARRPLRQPESNAIGCDDTIASGYQRWKKFSIQKRPGRIAVQQQHRVTRAFVDVVHALSVDSHEAAGKREMMAYRLR